MADISITIGATTKLFDLGIENGQKQLSVSEEPIIPIRSLSDIPGYGDLPPEKILAFAQNNWRGGMGQKEHFVLPDMYADGQNIDTREPNQIILGPLINTIGAIAATIIGFEFFANREYAFSTTKVYRLNTGSTSWDTVLTIAADTIECLGVYDDYIICGLTTGKYYISSTGDSGDWTQSNLDNAVIHNLVVAPPFSGTKDLCVAAKRPNEIRTTLTPEATVPTLQDSYNTNDDNADSSYGLIIRAQTFTPAASHTIGSVKLKLYRVGSPGEVAIKIYATDVSGFPTGAVLCSGTINGDTLTTDADGEWYTIYLGSGTALTATTKYAIVVSAPSGSIANYVNWREDATAPSYAGGNAEYSTDSGATWNDVLTADFMFEEYDIPVAGQGWLDPPYYIGDENSDITSLNVLNGTLLIGKTDGLYALPTDGRPVVLTPEFKQRRDSSNFKYNIVWQGILYCSVAGDIMEIAGSPSSVLSIDYMGPLERSPELSTLGSAKGITCDDKNLYVVLLVGTNYIIYTGRERYDEKYGLRWEWVPYIFLSTNVCGAIKVMQRTGVNPKLWFAYGTNVANIILSRSPNYPLGDSNYTFCTQGYLITSYFDANYDIWVKVFYQLWTIAENLTADINIKVYYEKDTDSSWTLLATITSNGVQSVDLSALSGKKFRLKIELNSNDSTKTPILREYIYRGVLQPETTRTLDFTVILGQSDMRKPSLDLAFLEGGRTATAPITLKDLRFGTTKYIMFLPNSPMEIEAIDEHSKQPTYRARIVAQQLNWTSP